MRKFLTLLIFSMTITGSSVFAQQIQLTDPTMTPVQAVQNVLLGVGINAFNIKFNGSIPNANNSQSSVRKFNSGSSNFPIPTGILLQTSTAPSANNDPDLVAINSSPEPITNGVVIEFDFVPSGNSLQFNYIFASAEYASYTCSQYNDVFGFFISGPGITGPYTNNAINLATIPNSNTPVGINTVNSGTPGIFGSATFCNNANPNWQSDAQYFTSAYNAAFGSLGYTGSTVILPAGTSLSCSDTFHIKMAISNVSDQALNSGVFLEANSFSSDGVEIGIQTSTSTSDTLLIEGCTEGIVYFTRPLSQAGDSLTIHFQVGGTAIYGVDYPALAAGNNVVLVPGQDSIALVISPIQDNIFEGPESIIIWAYTVNACGDTITSTGIIWIDDEPYNTVTSLDTTLLCISDSIPLWATTEGDFPPFTYSWTSTLLQGDTLFGDTIIGKGPQNGVFEYIVASKDNCGFVYYDTSIVIINQILAIDSMVQIPADCGENNGAVIGYGNPVNYTGTPHFTWSGPGKDSLVPSTSSTAWSDRSPGWYYFTIKDKVCEVHDSILVEQNPPPKASFDADPTSGMSPLNVVFTNTSDPATTYFWDFGNGSDTMVYNLNDQNSTYIDEGVYTVSLTAVEGGCTDTETATITVLSPMTYDTPNVFTPNGDGNNDFFTINAENASALEVVILNRWGNIVFESSDLNFNWNGKIDNTGSECTEGTYFYKFTITDNVGQKKKEHGFVQLFRGK